MSSSPGPLRRLLGLLGLLSLAPIGWLLATGAITIVDAAVRALVVLGVVLALGVVSRMWLGEVARGYDRSAARSSGGDRDDVS